jgi:ATP-binding cassette subfamily B protein
MVRTRIARINAFLQEHFAGAQTVQIFNAEVKSIFKFKEINSDYRKANIDTIFYYAVFFPLVDFIGAVGIALIIWYGGYRVMQNTPGHTVLTLGALVAFIQYSSFLFQPIRDISDKYNVLQVAVVASHRIFKTLDLPIAITSPAVPAKSGRVVGHIEFENVWFAYKGDDCSQRRFFKVEPGQSIALVGHTGPQVDYHQFAHAFLRRATRADSSGRRRPARVGLATPARKLCRGPPGHISFSGTIEGNIRLGRTDITEERVKWAAQEVSAEPFINRLRAFIRPKSRNVARDFQ